MNGLKRIIVEEPAALIGFVNALMAVLVLFGFNLTDEQSAGIIALVNVGLGLLTRAMVTPTGKAQEQAQDAADNARAKAIVERAMSPAETMTPAPTPEEWATVQQLRAERDRLKTEVTT